MQASSFLELLNAALVALRRAVETDPVLLSLLVLAAATTVALIAAVVAAPVVLAVGAAEALQRSSFGRRWAAG